MASLASILALAVSVSAPGPSVRADLPKILVVHYAELESDAVDPYLGLPNFISNDLFQSKRIDPIVWGPTDPAFRQAILDGKISVGYERPQPKDVQPVAKALGCEYVIATEVSNAKLKATDESAPKEQTRVVAVLYRNGRQVWKDDQGFKVTVSGIESMDNTLRSLASTLVARLFDRPLRDLKEATTAVDPGPLSGQAPNVVNTQVPDAVNTNEAFVERYRLLVSSGKIEEALIFARIGVDESPMEPQRREAAIEAMAALGLFEGAAGEARRAANIFPERIEFRRLAARYWTQAGRPDEAQRDLNEAVARDPEAAATRVMLGELAITGLEPEKALPHLDAAIEKQPTAYAYLLRATARAMIGGADGSLADMEKATTMDKAGVTAQYPLVFTVLDRRTGEDMVTFRDLLQRAVVQRSSKAVREEWELLTRRNTGRVALLNAFPGSQNRQQSLDLARLAGTVFAQTLLDLDAYLESGSEDQLVDARMNLGEAMKRASQSRERFAAESPSASKTGS